MPKAKKQSQQKVAVEALVLSKLRRHQIKKKIIPQNYTYTQREIHLSHPSSPIAGQYKQK
jgi:hypothetical protein